MADFSIMSEATLDRWRRYYRKYLTDLSRIDCSKLTDEEVDRIAHEMARDLEDEE